jgi:REP element-mobilizing transposase RayT
MDKFQNKYRIQSVRLQNWNYGSNGAYFITICTQNREHFFGDIVVKNSSNTIEKSMQLNEIGLLGEKYWMEIPKQFPYVELGNFVVMPNHTHGILIINHRLSIGLIDIPKTEINGGFARTKNPMLNDNISRVIRWYKGRCSFEIRKIHADFNWQSRFHDHIIRNSQSFETIQNYIVNNPKNWENDKFCYRKKDE